MIQTGRLLAELFKKYMAYTVKEWKIQVMSLYHHIHEFGNSPHQTGLNDGVNLQLWTMDIFERSIVNGIYTNIIPDEYRGL